MKTEICNCLSEIVTGVSTEEFEMLMEIPPEEKLGDYALPCFVLAKRMRKNPAMIAEDIAKELDRKKEVLGIDKVENVESGDSLNTSYACGNTIFRNNLE